MSTVRSAFSPMTLRVLAVASLSLAAATRQPSLAATAAAVGLGSYVWSLRSSESNDDPNSFRWAGLAVILILLLRFVTSADVLGEAERAARPIWIVLLVVAAVVAIVRGHARLPRFFSMATAMLAVLFVTGVMTVQEWRSDAGIDVYWMHRQAGEAVFSGENPYTDAVQVANGSPYAPEGSTIEGYPYPPVVVGTYAVTAKPADPRLVSSLSWIAVLVWVGWHARRPGKVGDTAYAMFLLLAGVAVWPLVWFASWTEPLSLALLLLTALWWERRPVLSAVALGLAIASKQYFIFLAPLLLLQKDPAKRKRLAISLSVATATILLGLIPDPTAFVTATILNLSEVGVRPDTQSLSGLLAANGIEFYLPAPLWIGLGLVLATIGATGSSSASSFLGRAGLALGMAFFIGQAFSNYWFLVLSLIAISAVLSEWESMDSRSDEEEPAAPLSASSRLDT